MKLPKLPYALNDLEPYITENTLQFHYGKHHQAYVDNVNRLTAGTELEDADLEKIVKSSSGVLFNNSAQVWNHSFYFMQFSKNPKLAPSGDLLLKIKEKFGSFDKFIEEFNLTAAKFFGSGWVWLVLNRDKELEIIGTSNAETPLTDDNLKSLITCDVWEHAYYLDKQNARALYITDFWKVLNWEVIESRYSS